MEKNSKQLLVVVSLLVLLTTGCSKNPKDPPASKANAVSGESTTAAKIPFQDGEYIYRSRVAKGTENCATEKEKCLSLEEYQRMCLEISSITKAMSASITSGLAGGDPALRKLFETGNFEDAKGEWLDKDKWRSDSGIIGACQVTLSASGIYEGTATRTTIKVFAQEFIVDKGDVLLHRASPGSAWML